MDASSQLHALTPLSPQQKGLVTTWTVQWVGPTAGQEGLGTRKSRCSYWELNSRFLNRPACSLAKPQDDYRLPLVGTMNTGLYEYSTVPSIYRVSQEECAKLREGVPYVKIHQYNPKHLCPKLNGYGDNGQRSLKLWQLLRTYWLPNTY